MLASMISPYPYESADDAWHSLCRHVLAHGERVQPRGQLTTEVRGANLSLSLRRPVVTYEDRRLNYRFMAAEAFWICTGRRDLAFLSRFAPAIARFSDDGETLAGAYGPPIAEQLPYILRSLTADRDTRQAVLTIWRPCPPTSKDIPCTVSMTFSIRGNKLHCHVFMRSSDVFLGVPYDWFSFSAVALKVAAYYNEEVPASERVEPGLLTYTAASSHVYHRNLRRYAAPDQANLNDALESRRRAVDPIPLRYVDGRAGFEEFLAALHTIMEEDPAHRPGWMVSRGSRLLEVA